METYLLVKRFFYVGDLCKYFHLGLCKVESLEVFTLLFKILHNAAQANEKKRFKGIGQWEKRRFGSSIIR